MGHTDRHLVMDKYSVLVTQVKSWIFGDPGDGLVLGALNSHSLGPGLMPRMEVCLFILSSSPESPKIFIWRISFTHSCSGPWRCRGSKLAAN